MNFAELINLLAAVGAFAFAAGVIIRRPQFLPQWLFLAGMVLLGVEALCQWGSLAAADSEQMLFWQRASFFPAAALPVVWVAFSLSFARGNARQFLRRWVVGLALLGAVPLGLSLGFWREMVSDAVWTAQAGNWIFPVSPTAKGVHLAIIIGAVAVLTNLECTFRAAVGTARWKIKYAVIGLALLCGARIYSSSQVFLYSATNVQLIVINSVALVVTFLFLAISAYRSKLAQLDIYPSSEALHKSFSVILAGLYLAIVGLLSKGVSALGGQGAFPWLAMFILVALGGFGVLLFSDRVRHMTRQFINTHFRRPSHDYRKIWSAFTHGTTAVLDRQAFTRAAVKLLSDTFSALSVTVWLADELERRFVFAASTSLESATADGAPVANEVYGELCALSDPAQPVDIDRWDTLWCVALRRSNPVSFLIGGHRFCLPLVAGGELVGLIVIGDRVGGAPFSTEDLELFKCLGDQIAASLRNLKLSEKLLHAREFEAFQVMSAFFVHDLKNTASTLSLMLRNLPIHFNDPTFREDALRGISNTVSHLNSLINRLSSFRQELTIKPIPADLNQLVSRTLKELEDSADLHNVTDLRPLPLILLDAEQFHKVVLNLLLNAKEAVGPGGEIRIQTSQENSWAILSVCDNGCGMSPEFLERSLFRPFQTTKKRGIGIGMFQSKMIVQAHQGRIEVQSQLGLGTTFRIFLPIPQN